MVLSGLIVFIDGVVHDLEHQVVQAGAAGVADVHGRTGPNVFDAFKQADRVRRVLLADTTHLPAVHLAVGVNDLGDDLSAGGIEDRHGFGTVGVVSVAAVTIPIQLPVRGAVFAHMPFGKSRHGPLDDLFLQRLFVRHLVTHSYTGSILDLLPATANCSLKILLNYTRMEGAKSRK
jgi:hypothetical protein